MDSSSSAILLVYSPQRQYARGLTLFGVLLTLAGREGQCCGSGMFIPDSDFYPSRIPDPGSRIPDPKTATKESCEKKLVVIPFWSQKFHKIKNYFIFERLKKKNVGKFQRIIELFTQKI
jgi:hypothetical protein